jgi:hypothetical protein
MLLADELFLKTKIVNFPTGEKRPTDKIRWSLFYPLGMR